MRFPLLLLFVSVVLQGAELRIVEGKVQRVEGGPGLLSSEAFLPGEMVHFSHQLQNFTRKENAVQVRFLAKPHDPKGSPLAPDIAGQISVSLQQEDKDWVPTLRGSFYLPPLLLGGIYQISLQAWDDIAGSTTQGEISFSVSGPTIDPSPGLAIRAIQFYRSEEDDRPLERSVYRAGEPINARFTIVGYRVSAQKEVDVVYGVKLTDSTGHVLFEEPSAAEDKSSGFYPKPYVPATLTFSIKPETPVGEFQLTVTARDRIGGSQAEAAAAFRLE